jgi:hypothetical protein
MAPSSCGRGEEASVQEGRRVAFQSSEESVLPSGVNAEDERFSLWAALAAMLILSGVTSVAYVLNANPFAISFNISFVYLPTVVLIMGSVVTKARRKS